MRRIVAGALVLLACGKPPPPRAGDGVEPGTGTPYPMLEPGPDLARLAAEFRGSCAFARPAGEALRYRRRLRLTGAARVHSSAELHNLHGAIGRIDRGAVVAGEGPLSGGRGRGAGYALVLRDSEGRVCRGYVAAAALEPFRPPGSTSILSSRATGR